MKMLTCNNMLLLLFILFLLFGCQYGNGDFISSSSNLIAIDANGKGNGNQSGTMQMFLQIGEKFNKMEKEIEGLKVKLLELEKRIKEQKSITSLTEQIDGIEWIKYNSNAYKWNAADCGPKMTISEDGLTVIHSGPNERNTVRTTLPIPAFNLIINNTIISFYYEIEILNKSRWIGPIEIGFCDKQFPLERVPLEHKNNSIRIWSKRGIYIDTSYTIFSTIESYGFERNDFIGLGIIHQPNSKMECFATWNGKLLGKAELPAKFTALQLFPSVNLLDIGDSIRVNFEKDKWQFKEFGRAL